MSYLKINIYIKIITNAIIQFHSKKMFVKYYYHAAKDVFIVEIQILCGFFGNYA